MNMEKQITALMQSIERKKERLKEWELRRSIIDREHRWAHECKIQVLRSEISEDEKLLYVERQHIEESFIDGQKDVDIFYDAGGYHFIETHISAEDYYKNKYKAE